MAKLSSKTHFDIIDWETLLSQIKRRTIFLSILSTYSIVILFITFYSDIVVQKIPIILFTLLVAPVLSYIYGKIVIMDVSKAFKKSYSFGIDVFLKNLILSLVTVPWLITFFITYYTGMNDLIVFIGVLIVLALTYASIGSVKYPLFSYVIKVKNMISKNNKLIIEYIIDKLSGLKPSCFVDDIIVFLEDFVINRKNNAYTTLYLLKVLSEMKKRELACLLMKGYKLTKHQSSTKKKIDEQYFNAVSILTKLSKNANVDQLIQLLKSELKNILIDVCVGNLTNKQLLSEKVDGIYNDLKYLAPLNRISSFIKSYTLRYYLQKTQIKDLFHAFSILRRATNFSPNKLKRFACRTAELLFKDKFNSV